jgi:hypothetical protein
MTLELLDPEVIHHFSLATLGQSICLWMIGHVDMMIIVYHFSDLFHHTIIEFRATIGSYYRQCSKNTDSLKLGFNTLHRSIFRWVQTKEFPEVIHDKDNIFVAQLISGSGPRVSKDNE